MITSNISDSLTHLYTYTAAIVSVVTQQSV